MDAPVQVFSCKESSFVPLVLSVRYATDSMLQKNALKSGCNRCKTGALYQSFGHLPLTAVFDINGFGISIDILAWLQERHQAVQFLEKLPKRFGGFFLSAAFD
jgi:hypothetical protein